MMIKSHYWFDANVLCFLMSNDEKKRRIRFVQFVRVFFYLCIELDWISRFSLAFSSVCSCSSILFDENIELVVSIKFQAMMPFTYAHIGFNRSRISIPAIAAAAAAVVVLIVCVGCCFVLFRLFSFICSSRFLFYILICACTPVRIKFQFDTHYPLYISSLWFDAIFFYFCFIWFCCYAHNWSSFFTGWPVIRSIILFVYYFWLLLLLFSMLSV